MKVWDFEPWLVGVLASTPGIAEAVPYRKAGLPWLYGVRIQSTSGVVVLIRLTRGSGEHDDLTNPPPEHAANVERVANAAPAEVKPLPDRMAAAAEQLLRDAITRAGNSAVGRVQTFAERRAIETRGVVVYCADDDSELYLTLGC